MKRPFFTLITFFFLILATAGFAQTAENGTYQFLYRTDPASISVSLTTAELQQIESLRKSDEPVYVFYNENLVIKILPTEKIQDPDFTPPAASALNEDAELRMNRYKIRNLWDNNSK